MKFHHGALWAAFGCGLAFSACNSQSAGTSLAQPCINGVCPGGFQCVMDYCVPLGGSTNGMESGSEGVDTFDTEDTDWGTSESTGETGETADTSDTTDTNGDGDGDGDTTDTNGDGDGDTTDTTDTTDTGMQDACGWLDAEQYYACGGMGEDPGGLPINCPDGLMPGNACESVDPPLSGEGCCAQDGTNWYCGEDENGTYIVEEPC